MPDHHRPRAPPTSGGGDGERRSGQSGAILNQVRGRQPDRPPAARPIGSHVQALACPERHDLARSDRDAAPDRCGSLAPRQRNKDRVGRYGDKGDPRQLLVGSRQSQAEQGDLGQPRPKLAGTGDEQGEAALLAHGNRKILRLAEHRRDATRHCHPGPSAVEPRVPGVIHAWLSNFGRNAEVYRRNALRVVDRARLAQGKACLSTIACLKEQASRALSGQRICSELWRVRTVARRHLLKPWPLWRAIPRDDVGRYVRSGEARWTCCCASLDLWSGS